VWEEDGGSVVSIARPETMFELVKNDALRPIVEDADKRLRRVLEQVRHE